jgi:hypothetical protein
MIYELHEEKSEEKIASTCFVHMLGMVAGSVFFFFLRC